MTAMSLPSTASVTDRARQSRGTSADAIYDMVARALSSRHSGGGTLLDVGCGTGNLRRHLSDRFHRYIGADVVRYGGLPEDCEFVQINLDSGRIPLSDASADVVAAVETVEHLENPRAFVRELVRVTKPGGWIVVTTPNQLSLLSKLTLLLCNEFNAFRSGSYPAHLTALLEVDLKRIANECGLHELSIAHSECGRVAFTPWHYPRWLSRLCPRALSDNLLLAGRKRGD